MPGSNDRLPRSVYYTSNWGCPAISDTTNPQSANDATSILQDLLNIGANNPLEVVVDQPLLVNQFKVYSGTTIRGLYRGSFLPNGSSTYPMTGLWFKKISTNPSDSTYTTDCMIGNANRRTNYNSASPATSPLTCSYIIDQDITIRDLFIDGQKRNGVSPDPTKPWNSNPFIVNTVTGSGQAIATQLLLFVGVHNLLIENVCLYDPPGFHTRFSNIDCATLRRIQLFDPLYFQGLYESPGHHTDGLHFCGPWNDLTIDNIYGSTGDDFVALLSGENNVTISTSSWTWPNYFYYGHGLRTTVTNLKPVNAADLIRVATSKDTVNNNGNSRIDQCVISKVTGSVIQGGVQGGLYAGGTDGDTITDLTMDNWNLTIVGQGSSNGPCGIQLGHKIGKLSLINHQYRDVQGNSIAHQINTTTTANIGDLVIDGYRIREDSSEVSNPLPAINIGGGTIDQLIIRNGGWFRNAATNLAYATVTGGSTVNKIVLNEITCNHISNILSVTSGTVGSISTVGISHRNALATGAASGAAIYIGPGVGVSNLTTCGSDTNYLIGAISGVITTKRTDGTERGI